MTKKQSSTNLPIEKNLTIAGIALVVLGIFANCIATPNNLQYMYDVLDLGYYYRYVILLGGGFLVGVGVSLRKSKALQDRLFSGATYALIAMSVFMVLDNMRLLTMQDLLFPWGKYSFYGLPLAALLLTAVVAFVAERQSKQLSDRTKLVAVALFLFTQLYQLAYTVFYLSQDAQGYSTDIQSILLSVGYYITHPLVIALAAYLLLGNVKSRLNRLFYSTFIGATATYLMLVLWEFSMDPTVTATNIFSMFTLVIVALVSVLLILKTRVASKKR